MPDLYLIEGGINRWLDVYAIDPCIARDPGVPDNPFEDRPAHVVLLAAGERSPAASPELPRESVPASCAAAELPGLSTSREARIIRESALSRVSSPPSGNYERKVKIQKAQARKGGCG